MYFIRFFICIYIINNVIYLYGIFAGNINRYLAITIKNNYSCNTFQCFSLVSIQCKPVPNFPSVNVFIK